jgi:hypothetical protein
VALNPSKLVVVALTLVMFEIMRARCANFNVDMVSS